MESAIADIITGCKQGEPRMQKELYLLYYQDMMKVCLRYTRDMDKASTVYNDAMLKVFNNIAKYEEQDKLAGWVKRIVVNTAIDYVRIKSNFLPEVSTEFILTESHPIDATVFAKMSGKEIRQLLLALPEKPGVVFNLYVYEEYNHNEIGELLKIPAGTSRYYLSEARRLLKEIVQNPNSSLNRAI